MSTWYYAKKGEQLGPISEADLKALIVAGKVDRSDLVWRDGLPDWVPAGSQLALFPVSPASQAARSDSPVSPLQNPPAQAQPRQDPATSALPLNTGLFRVHRLFFIAFIAFAAIMLVMGILIFLQGKKDWPVGLMGLGFLPIGMAHWYAAKGVRSGQAYGKIISRIFGTLWLFGFPLGTILGVYVLFQTGQSSWNGGTGQATARGAWAPP